MSTPVIALTPGEPAGVGPDLAIQLAQRPPAGALVLIADPALLAERAKLLRLPFTTREWQGRESAAPGVYVLPVKTARPVMAGELDKANAPYVIETLKSAVAGCMGGEFDALVTGPVHKGNINDAGIAFTGHTELLAELSGAPQPVMMLAAPGLRVALVTIHLPLAAVPKAITPSRLTAVLEVLHANLQHRFGIADPVILVCGLNPHAGESGHLGREEIDVIEPVIKFLVRPGHAPARSGTGRYRVHSVPVAGRGRGAGHVSRPGSAGAEAPRLRACRQRHAGTAVRAHFGGSRHGAGTRRHRPRRRIEPGRRGRNGAYSGKQKAIDRINRIFDARHPWRAS